MKHFISIFLFITLLSFLSCGKNTKAIEEVDSTALTIAVLPTYDCIPFYYAEQEGLFDSLGVNIRLLTYPSSMDADTAFVNGEALGVISDVVKAALWRAKGDSVKIIMALDPEISLVTCKASRLFQLSSIKERIIAITRHSILDFTCDKILESIKMQETDLNKPQINNLYIRTQMTDQNQYDGALLPEPYTTETTKVNGAKLLTSSKKIGLHNMGALIFNDSIISSRKEDIKKVITAYTIAVERLNNEKQYPLNYLPKDPTVEIPDSAFEYKMLVKPELPSDSLLQKVNSWLIKRTLIKTPTSYKALIDSTFVK